MARTYLNPRVACTIVFLISVIPYTTKYYLMVSLGRLAGKTPMAGDEPMAGQNNSGSNSLDEKNDSIISSNIIFRGSVLRQIEEKRKPRRYIYIGTVRVEITELLPN